MTSLIFRCIFTRNFLSMRFLVLNRIYCRHKIVDPLYHIMEPIIKFNKRICNMKKISVNLYHSISGGNSRMWKLNIRIGSPSWLTDRWGSDPPRWTTPDRGRSSPIIDLVKLPGNKSLSRFIPIRCLSRWEPVKEIMANVIRVRIS